MGNNAPDTDGQVQEEKQGWWISMRRQVGISPSGGVLLVVFSTLLLSSCVPRDADDSNSSDVAQGGGIVDATADQDTKLSEMGVAYSIDSFTEQIEVEHPYACSLFVVSDIDPNAITANGKTPLMTAVEMNNLELARQLIEAGADVTLVAPDSGSTALHYAASVDCARLLIEHGANVGAVDKLDSEALFYAADGGDLNTVKLLLGHGANAAQINDMGLSPLSGAIKQNNLEMAKLLTAAGAPLEAQDDHGRTPIWGAVLCSAEDIFYNLIEQEADVQRTIPDGPTLLHVAAQTGIAGVVEKLLSMGLDPNARDGRFQSTPLHFAAGNGFLDCVQLLVDARAELNAQDANGMTPLEKAQERLEDNRDALHPDPEALAADLAAAGDAIPEWERRCRMSTLSELEDTIEFLKSRNGDAARMAIQASIEQEGQSAEMNLSEDDSKKMQQRFAGQRDELHEIIALLESSVADG